MLERNPHLKKIVAGAMPYGGEAKDHEIVHALGNSPYLFSKKKEKFQLVYAGAMLPKAYEPLEKILAVIADNKKDFADVEFHFIGTGSSPNDVNGHNIKPLAVKYGLWENIIFEYPARIPYLDVLVHLDIADAVFILGSTEPHYTPSKVYQAILAQKPILAVLHEASSAVKVIRESGAGKVLSFAGPGDTEKLKNCFANHFSAFRDFVTDFKKEQVDSSLFNEYSARAVTEKLAGLLNKAISS